MKERRINIEPLEFMSDYEYFNFSIYSMDGRIIHGSKIDKELLNPPENLRIGLKK